MIYNIWLPYALMYGCPYELFWTLNPTKLEPWRKKKEYEDKQRAEVIDFFAWRIGYYNVQAMGVWWGKNSPYPQKPEGRGDDRVPPPNKGEVMTDGARFRAFAVAHNQALKKKREKQSVDSRG